MTSAVTEKGVKTMPSPSEWRVSTRYVLNQKFYQVYRLKDKTKPLEPDNMEIISNWDNKTDAEEAAKRHNIRDAERFWERKLP